MNVTIERIAQEGFIESCKAYELDTDAALELAEVFSVERGRLPKNYSEVLEVLE